MENKFKNEMQIEIGGEKILLRPTFENLANMETDMGGLPYLAWKYGQGVDETGKITDRAKSVRSLPGITDTAKIIFYNQAEKKFNLDEILELVLQEGIKASAVVVLYLGRCTAGNKMAVEPSARQKKSSPVKSPVENP